MGQAAPQILIVDDEPRVCKALTAMVSSWGMTAHGLTDPRLVVNAVRKTFYNILILNVVMPKMSGLELLAEIGGLCSNMKILVMADHADKDQAFKALKLGAFDSLEKPIVPDLLCHAVKRALKVQQIEAEHENILEELRQGREALLASTSQVEELTRELVETKNAISVLERNIERTQQATAQRIVLRLRALVMPIIDRLRQDKPLEKHALQLALLARYIEELTSGLAISQGIPALTVSELRIASMIKHGLSSEAIATHLGISPDTVRTHRKNIRNKLKIIGTRKNLGSYLASLEHDAIERTLPSHWERRTVVDAVRPGIRKRKRAGKILKHPSSPLPSERRPMTTRGA